MFIQEGLGSVDPSSGIELLTQHTTFSAEIARLLFPNKGVAVGLDALLGFSWHRYHRDKNNNRPG